MALVSKTFSQIITFTRASTATYFDATGTLQSAAIDAPRLDYNPSTLAAQGFLVEEARTNLVLQSEDFATTWTVAGTATITTNQLTSPAGTLTADLLTTPTGGPNRVQQAGTAVVSTTYAASMFVKAGNINGLNFRVFFSGGTSVDTYADFIFSSATFSGVVGAGVFSSQAVGNGWFRITCVLASGNNTAWDIRVGGLIGTAQTGTTAYVWGAQLEAGAFPTSYIPTTTTALTRSADVASVNTLSPWYNATEGTLFAEVTVPQLGRSARLVVIDAGSTTDMIDTTVSGANAFAIEAVAGGVYGGSSLTANTITANAIQKTAATYSTGSNETVCLNGGTVASANVTLPSVSLTTMRLGQQSNFAATLNGWLRRIVYYPRRLSNAELQSITT